MPGNFDLDVLPESFNQPHAVHAGMTEEDTATTASRAPSTWLALPAPIQRVFARFPLLTYEANTLPQTAPQKRNQHILYSFQRPQDNDSSTPSCNPTCLKWQALLRFHDIQHQVRSSNNHASPSGALPFVVPGSNPKERPGSPIISSKIPKWITSQGGREEKLHSREEAYTALVDHDIRNAWLYSLYLDEQNFARVAYPLYCQSASSNGLVQQAVARQLQSAARDELLKSYNLIVASDLYERAAKALEALATLLGDKTYFFEAEYPGLFDASVFAYTHLLLDTTMPWQNNVLPKLLRKHPTLVSHRNHLFSHYFIG